MMTIGIFAQKVQLSIKTIRFYQEKGLLAPAYVDPFTHYRYYDDACVERARLIAQLRSFELPLREIRSLLAEPDIHTQLVTALERQRARLEAQITQYTNTIRQLDTTLQESLMSRTTYRISQHPSERLDRWLARLNSEAHQALRAPLPNIAVSSVAGCAGGEALAAALAHRVAFEAWDRPLLETLAADDTTRQCIFDTLDDAQRAWCDSALRRTHTPTSDLLRVALAIAAHGGAILLEMGAHLLLPPDSERDPDTAAFRRGALRVRLNPTPSMLIPHHAERHAMDEEQARQDLDTMAQDLERFAQKTYGKPLNDPAHHDLLLNSHTLTLFNAVEICVRAYEAKFALDAGWSFVGRG